jgi:hypothetical protein
MSSNIKIPNIFGIEINIKKTISHFWDRPVPIFSDVRFSYLALVQDIKITCVLPACCSSLKIGTGRSQNGKVVLKEQYVITAQVWKFNN